MEEPEPLVVEVSVMALPTTVATASPPVIAAVIWLAISFFVVLALVVRLTE